MNRIKGKIKRKRCILQGSKQTKIRNKDETCSESNAESDTIDNTTKEGEET